MNPALRRTGLAVLALGALALPLLWWQAGGDAAHAPSQDWDQAVASLEGDPAPMMAFLAERARTREGRWDYRWMAPPARTLWAVLRCERGLVGRGDENPTWEEASEAYAELGLPELADAAGRMAAGGAGAAEAWRAACTASRSRLGPARRGFAERHRRDLE